MYCAQGPRYLTPGSSHWLARLRFGENPPVLRRHPESVPLVGRPRALRGIPVPKGIVVLREALATSHRKKRKTRGNFQSGGADGQHQVPLPQDVVLEVVPVNRNLHTGRVCVCVRVCCCFFFFSWEGFVGALVPDVVVVDLVVDPDIPESSNLPSRFKLQAQSELLLKHPLACRMSLDTLGIDEMCATVRKDNL